MKIKNWSQFQHFKDRRPPWIKLYREILDDIEWHELDARSAKVLVMIWLIASESDGCLPDTKKLAFRLRMTEKDTEASLIKLSHWLEQDDINVISTGYQDDLPETETETETETERETKTELSVEPQSVSLPVVEVPVLGNKSFGVNKEMVAEWSMAYPAVDVVAELHKMRVWSLSNPTKQKTLTGIARFVNAWLSKAQDQVGKVPISGFETQGDRNAKVISGLTRGILGGGNNVKLLGN
jgi:hypothetical protein